MPTDQTPKQLISQRIKDASNILITVSRDPSVDELSAALALTLLLDKMDKVATAVFSGAIPPAIEFLQPGKTFDTNVDGLRDFIIALDKSKADRLRYKVEDDVVRVFITPYKTTISEDDLTFSQGDFNVDLVVAFGVDKREDLDTAITAHGRILHDAGVVTINQIPGDGSLGEVDWSDTEASSLCEMLMSLTESLQSGLLDEPISTAILTGLVSATDRFRNEKTSPKVMTMSAQLMAAGANQQLIAEKLETVEVPDEQEDPTPKKDNDGEMKVIHDTPPPEEPKEDSPEEQVPLPDAVDAIDEKAQQVAAADSADAVAQAKRELAAVTPPPSDEQLTSAKGSSWRDAPLAPPSTGGTLSATTEEAEEAKREAEDNDKNHVILSHDAPSSGNMGGSSLPPVLNAAELPSSEPTVPDIFAAPASSAPVSAAAAPEASAPATTSTASGMNFEETPVAVPSPVAPAPMNPTLADLEAEVNRQVQSAPQAVPQAVATPPAIDSARAAVDAALGSQPFDPSGQPLAAAGAQSFGDIGHDASMSQPAPAATAPTPPPLPPMPDFSTLPPMPPLPPAPAPAADVTLPSNNPTTTPAMPAFGLPEQQVTPGTTGAAPASPADPSQFKLPGQS